MDLVVIAVYIGAMIGIGFYAKGRAKSESDFLVAGRRLGPLLYSGTMAAVVLGGASTLRGASAISAPIHKLDGSRATHHPSCGTTNRTCHDPGLRSPNSTTPPE